MSDILDDVIKEELPTVSAEETTLPDEQTEQNLPEEKKRYITKEELEQFINKYPDDETLAQIYVDSAIEAINRYLGYDVELKEYETISYGDNGNLFSLEAYPLVKLISVKENNIELDTSLFRIKNKNYLEYNFGKGVFSKDNLYKISYTAGFENVPKEIKIVALKVASVLWESEGGNLAVSSTSFADNGSRVFNNFKTERFLQELDSYKIGLLGL